jgi:PAS domain S-box-containing protein
VASERVVSAPKPADGAVRRVPSTERVQDHAAARVLLETLRRWAAVRAPDPAAEADPAGVAELEGLAEDDARPARQVLQLFRDLLQEVDRARARAEASERELRDLVESLDAVVWRAEYQERADGPSPRRYVFVSGRARHLLGVEAARWVEDPAVWPRLIHPEDREQVLATCRARAGRDEDYELEYRMMSATGETLWVRERIHVVRDASGRPRELRGILEDVTEARRAVAAQREREAHRQQAQKMEALRRLAGGLAHDLGNTLAAIKLRADLLLMAPADPAAVRRQAAAIVGAAEQAGALARELLALGRERPGQRVPVDVAGLLSALRSALQAVAGERIELGLEVGPGLWGIAGDPAELERALLSLAHRACHAMPRGGRLVIRCDNRLLLEGRASIPAGAWVVVEVCDDGPAMDAESQARLFEPFRPEGGDDGLGLFRVDRIVRQHGGHVEVESEPGRGTTIRLWLPRSETHPGAGPGGGPATILLVEDDAVLRGLIACVLEQEGYRVLAAASSAEAEQLLAAAEGPVDLLLADVVLPGSSGPELASRLSAQGRALPVVFMSGDGEGVDRFQAGGPAPALVLGKPFTLEALSRAVRRALEGPRA